MSKFNTLFRKFVNKKNQKRLRNTTFSLLSSNCNGAFICHDLGLQFRSPFVNLWLKPADFLKYLQNIEHYMNCELSFIKEEGIPYPIGLLDDIHIYFQHYHTEEEARRKWVERTQRIDLTNLFILFSDRDGCTYEQLQAFDRLPHKNKIVFTNKPYPELKSAFYIKGFENESNVGNCYEYINPFSGRKIFDNFDYVSWFNQNLS